MSVPNSWPVMPEKWAFLKFLSGHTQKNILPARIWKNSDATANQRIWASAKKMKLHLCTKITSFQCDSQEFYIMLVYSHSWGNNSSKFQENTLKNAEIRAKNVTKNVRSVTLFWDTLKWYQILQLFFLYQKTQKFDLSRALCVPNFVELAEKNGLHGIN